MSIKPISHFRRWVYHTLPLVYDDSLSYMELLSKVIDYCNELRKANENTSDEVKKAIEAIEELQQYVDTHFDEKMEEAIERYFSEHDLVNSVNGMSGQVQIDNLPNPHKLILMVHDPSIHEESEATIYEYDGNGEVTARINLPVIPAPPVSSVNGLTGAVVIATLPNPKPLNITYGGTVSIPYDGSKEVSFNIPQPVYPVTSVNDKTGAVVLTIDDLNGIAKVVNSVNGNVLLNKTVSIVKLYGDSADSGKVLTIDSDGKIVATTIGVASDSVLSVNGKLGAVVLVAADVGAIADENGTVTLAHLANAGPDNIGKGLVVREDGTIGYGEIGGVIKVNGKTGTVVLSASDVGAIANEPESVKANNIAGGAVGAYQIAANSITRDKLAFNLNSADFSRKNISEMLVPKSTDYTPRTLVSFHAEPGVYSINVMLKFRVDYGSLPTNYFCVSMHADNETTDELDERGFSFRPDTYGSPCMLFTINVEQETDIRLNLTKKTSGSEGTNNVYLSGKVDVIRH